MPGHKKHETAQGLRLPSMSRTLMTELKRGTWEIFLSPPNTTPQKLGSPLGGAFILFSPFESGKV